MKKLYVLILLFVLSMILVPKPTYADMFSKPTATIEIKGLNKSYDFEILVPYESDAHVLKPDDYAHRLEGYYKDDYPLALLNGYQDDDGFVARTIYSVGAPSTLNLIDTYTIKVGYYSAPRTFKILIILDDDTFISSKVIHRKMFTSAMIYDLDGVTLDVSKSGVGMVTEHIPMLEFTGKYFIRVLLTIGIELLILLIFMYKDKKSYLIVGVVNFLTQSALTIAMVIGYYFWAAEVGLIITLVLGEIAVFAIEMIIYAFTLKEQSSKKAKLYGFVANIITLLISIFTLGSLTM